MFTCRSPCCSGLPQKSSGSGARGAPPTGVASRTSAPSQRSRSVASWATALYGAPSTPSTFSPAVLQRLWSPLRLYLHSRLLPSLDCCSGGTLLAFLRPVVPYTLAILRSALGRFLGRWCLTYQCSSPGAVDRADSIPALWKVIVGFQ